VLDIEQGRVQFMVRRKLGSIGDAPHELELTGPISITATSTIEETVIQGRRLEDVIIRMQVSGQLPNHLFVEVSSSPPLADEQIYALLGTAPFPGAGSLLAGGDLEDVLNEQFVSALGAAFRAYIFQPFEEDLRELLGLSVFEVSFAFNQPIDVRIGGYLVENLLITYETSLVGHAETQYELEVSYKVDRRFELTYGTDSEGDNRFLVEYVREF
jgi:autotransporter translocation and assembly factor TamB